MAATQGSEPDKLERKTIHLPNDEVYDLWAPTYDSDGNILQALDSFALQRTMFPKLLDALASEVSHQESEWEALQVIDLGCGTGRAMLGLMNALQAGNADLSAKRYQSIYLTGLDSSPGMLKIAEQKIPGLSSLGTNHMLIASFQQFDILDDEAKSPVLAHALMSTLVLEHVPLDVYFSRARSLLKPDGLFLLTNMHPDMGNASFSTNCDPLQSNEETKRRHIATAAGFIDAAKNTKIRGQSYAHTIREVLNAAAEHDFETVGNVQELAVQEWMLQSGAATGSKPLLTSRGEKWVGTMCWFGVIMRRKS